MVERDEVVVFGAQVTVIVPLLLPEVKLTVTQDAEEATFQEVFERISKELTPPPEAKLSEVADTVKVRLFADWETVTI